VDDRVTGRRRREAVDADDVQGPVGQRGDQQRMDIRPVKDGRRRDDELENAAILALEPLQCFVELLDVHPGCPSGSSKVMVAISGRWSETNRWMYSAAHRAEVTRLAVYCLSARRQSRKVPPHDPLIIGL